MSDRLLKESDVIEAFKGRESLIHDAYTAVAIIRSVPSADRPQGKWICHEGGWKNFDYYPTKYECDQCHHYVDVASDKKFCPNCGARMFAKDTNVPNKKGADDENV